MRLFGLFAIKKSSPFKSIERGSSYQRKPMDGTGEKPMLIHG